MAGSRWLNRPAARRERDELHGAAVPIVFAGPLQVTLPDGRVEDRPFVQLDVTDHPELQQAFAAVHAAGLQSVLTDTPYRYVYVDGHGYLAATLAFTAPHGATATIVLVWPDQQAVFDLLAQGQPLMVTLRDLHPPFDWRDAIGLQPGPELARVLAEWRAMQADDL